MTKLSVNVNKIATLRNARGHNNPNVLQMALDCVAFGAQGITVHPRPDERHIRIQDVYDISEALPKDIEFNIEGYPSDDFLALVREIKPAQCTLVPDPPHVLTSNAGWSIVQNLDFLKQVLQQLQDAKVRSSLFIDPFTMTSTELEGLAILKPDRIELYTQAYAEGFSTPHQAAILAEYQRVAKNMNNLSVGVNAGHDLDRNNLHVFVTEVPHVLEVSIGHALICDALYLGMERTIAEYLACLRSS